MVITRFLQFFTVVATPSLRAPAGVYSIGVSQEAAANHELLADMDAWIGKRVTKSSPCLNLDVIFRYFSVIFSNLLMTSRNMCFSQLPSADHSELTRIERIQSKVATALTHAISWLPTGTFNLTTHQNYHLHCSYHLHCPFHPDSLQG